jgi:hypothetical protein
VPEGFELPVRRHPEVVCVGLELLDQNLCVRREAGPKKIDSLRRIAALAW